MPKFSEKSKQRLETCDEKIQMLFKEVIKHRDCTVLCGHRSAEEQFELYKQGRAEINGVWQIVDKKKVVTNVDGSKKVSMHNYIPSKAVDVAPYPIDWKDLDKWKDFVGFVKGVASQLGVRIINGGDWKMKDYPHWQLEE